MSSTFAQLSTRLEGIMADFSSRACALVPPHAHDSTALYFRVRGLTQGGLWNELQTTLNGSRIGRIGHARARLAYHGLRRELGTFRAEFGGVEAFRWEVVTQGRDLLVRVEVQQPVVWEFVTSSGATFPMADVIHTLDCEVEGIGAWEWDKTGRV